MAENEQITQKSIKFKFKEIFLYKSISKKRAQIKTDQSKNKKLPIFHILLTFLKLFLSVSTIHGCAHLTAKKRHPLEIIIWISLMGVAIYGASILSSETWYRYQENPTVISMERDRYSWNTSFPAATICPTSELDENLLTKYVSDMQVKNKTALRLFLKSLSNANYKNFNEVLPYHELPSDKFMETLLQLQTDFAPSATNSLMHGFKFYLEKTITEMGICYTFNSNLAVYNSPRYWNNNRWNLLQANQTFFVHPLDGEVFANVVNMSTGFHFYVHGPYEVVDIASKGVYSPNGHFVQIYLSGLTIFTSDSARRLAVNQRKCRFYHESNLRHSPVYSYVLCRMECRASLAKRLCGCIPHFYRKMVSTIHGCAHLTAKNRHPVEILLWISLTGSAIYGASILSSATWYRYQENPTVISMERDRYSWNTSFPAATICPTLKVNDKLMATLLSTMQVKNKTELELFLRSLAKATYKTFHEVLPYHEIPSDQFMKILLQLQQDFRPTVSNSGSHGQKYFLEKTLTEMGICYSFNSNLAIYNSPGYWDSNKWKLLPENYTLSVHPLDGEVFANVVNMSTGFDIYLHGPYEVVDVASKGVYSPDGHFLQVYLSGLTIFTTERARKLAVNQRKCRFYDESDLRHSPVYSYVLCRMECRASLAKQLCGCIPHFYRKLDGDRVCDVAGLHCLAKYTERLITLKRECTCYPNCDEVNYVVEDLDTREWFLGSNLQWGLKEYPRMRLRRDVIFGFTDVLVSIGGMAGLFLGCSVLSFIEILYFFTIRLFWFVTKYGKDTKDMYNGVH